MRTTVRLMLSVTLVGLVVMVIVFFALFGILPAKDVAKVFKKNSTSTESNQDEIGDFIYSTTTVVKKEVVRKEVKVNTSTDDKGDDLKSPELSKDKKPGTKKGDKNKKKKDDKKQEKKKGAEKEVEPQLIKQTLPPVVFNTSGKIKAVKVEKNAIIVNSDGSNFEVIPPSGVVEIVVLINKSTNVLNPQNKEISIKELKKGQSVSIEASENIKNDKKFVASNIKLQN
ncbi:MAG: hypothetical protein ABEI53_02385 [Candidatus Magasanikbacteria bacterium]